MLSSPQALYASDRTSQSATLTWNVTLGLHLAHSKTLDNHHQQRLPWWNEPNLNFRISEHLNAGIRVARFEKKMNGQEIAA